MKNLLLVLGLSVLALSTQAEVIGDDGKVLETSSKSESDSRVTVKVNLYGETEFTLIYPNSSIRVVMDEDTIVTKECMFGSCKDFPNFSKKSLNNLIGQIEDESGPLSENNEKKIKSFLRTYDLRQGVLHLSGTGI